MRKLIYFLAIMATTLMGIGEASARKLSFLGENKQSQLILLTDVVYPRIGVTFGGNDVFRDHPRLFGR